LESRIPSIILAWLSASEMMASSSPRSVSKRPPLASKHEEYKMVSSVLKNREIRCSNALWMSCVPQIKRTEAMP